MNQDRRLPPTDLDWADLLSPAQLAQRHGTTVGTLANRRSAGTGVPYVKLGGSRVRYRLADVLEYERAHLVATVEGVSA